MRDYLYIPLGGNRKGAARTYINLSLTMLLGGLWHGASWNFVLWGALHGAALAMHRALGAARGERELLPRAFAIPATFLFVTLCWVPFRSSDASTTLAVLAKLAGLGGPGTLFLPIALFLCAVLVIGGHVIGHALDESAESAEPAPAWLSRLGFELRTDPISGWYVVLGARGFWGALVLTLWILLVCYFAPTGTSPFIYFQF